MSQLNDRANEGLESQDTEKDDVTKLASHAAFLRTLSVSEEVELAASAGRTWVVIKDFQRWQTWHPAFASTEITKGSGNAPGTVRVLTTNDGAKFNEELLMHDATSRSYQYRIIDSPLPISGYVSTIEVKESKRGSRVVWSSTFTVDPSTSDEAMKKTIAGVYRAGLDSLKASLN